MAELFKYRLRMVGDGCCKLSITDIANKHDVADPAQQGFEACEDRAWQNQCLFASDRLLT